MNLFIVLFSLIVAALAAPQFGGYGNSYSRSPFESNGFGGSAAKRVFKFIYNLFNS